MSGGMITADVSGKAEVVLTTKGDIATFDTARVRKGVSATNYTGIQADSAIADGLTYGATARSTLTGTGSLLYSSGANTLAELSAGTGEYTLKMNSGATSPEWVNVSATPTNVQYSVATMGGVEFDFDSSDAIQTKTIVAATAFTGNNYAAGKSITLFITTDGSERAITFPSGWIFQGTMPTTQAASKVGTLTLLCSGTTEASVRCAYAVEE